MDSQNVIIDNLTTDGIDLHGFTNESMAELIGLPEKYKVESFEISDAKEGRFKVEIVEVSDDNS